MFTFDLTEFYNDFGIIKIDLLGLELLDVIKWTFIAIYNEL